MSGAIIIIIIVKFFNYINYILTAI